MVEQQALRIMTRSFHELVRSCPPGHGLRQHLLDLAAMPVRIVNAQGKKETVSLFEARLLELAAGRAPRRLHCQDFIWLMLRAASMSAHDFDAFCREAGG